MIIFVKVVFNLVLSISKTHLIVKLETFPHLRRARAGFGWGRGAVRPPPNNAWVTLICQFASIAYIFVKNSTTNYFSIMRQLLNAF